ncbi:MAG: hypothetical protein DRQ47_00315 [Gammaproteobacteria bacterium]|nr:MAG: hypothetical protein DRQ47_00315 [Gammaproteobacteria bacterium]
MSLTTPLREGLGGGNNTPVIKELQGLNVSLVSGANANTKIDIAAIRSDDTVISAVNNDAGTLTDVTSTITINALNAAGTLTAVSAVDTDVFVVNGVTYTISTAGGDKYTEVQVGGDDTIMAASMVAAINGYEGSHDGADAVVATSALGVVTITAKVQGAAGNAITIASVDSTITASAATLENGSDTGGIQSSGATDQLLVHWFNKQ